MASVSNGISVRRSITSTAPPLASVKRAAAMADSSSIVPQLTIVARGAPLPIRIVRALPIGSV